MFTVTGLPAHVSHSFSSVIPLSSVSFPFLFSLFFSRLNNNRIKDISRLGTSGTMHSVWEL